MRGSVHLVQVDVIGAEPAQAVLDLDLDLAHDPLPRAALLMTQPAHVAEIGYLVGYRNVR
jgi:hypothetical protein